MSKLNPTFSDFKNWDTKSFVSGQIIQGVPGMKFFGIDQGSPLHNRGHFDSRIKERMKLIDNGQTFSNSVSKLFEMYKKTHGKPIYTGDPSKDLFAYNRWMKRAQTFIKAEQKKAIPWNYRQFGELGIEDSTPRKNKRPTSSWLKNIQVIGDTLSLYLGPSKNNPSGWYDYKIGSPKDLQRFLQCPSMGRTVSKLARGGSSLNGITVIPSLRKSK